LRIIGLAKLNEFARRHARARKPLANWEKVVKAAAWTNSADMKMTFNTVDYVDGKTIFDVGGNNFRLIASIDFAKEIVQVTGVLTHAEYVRDGWKN
jgi:mRNA interferase HigB